MLTILPLSAYPFNKGAAMKDAISDFIDSLQADFNKAQPIFPTFLSVSIEIKKKLDADDFNLEMLVPVIQFEPVLSAKILGSTTRHAMKSKTLKMR
jgi:hypothetical protein